jgi:two-component system invasion response regulator UvrY
MSKTIKIVVVDDHSLFRKGVVNLIQQIDSSFEVIAEAANGKEFLKLLEEGLKPDLTILDLDMPQMDGHATTKAIRKTMPDFKILMLTMKNDEISLIRLLKAGVNGYLSKDVEPEELKKAILDIVNNGYYYTDVITGSLLNALRLPGTIGRPHLNDQEYKFLNLACSEDTYKEIADKMNLSEKTIDGYRARLFDKLTVKSRVGLVLYAIRNNMVEL